MGQIGLKFLGDKMKFILSILLLGSFSYSAPTRTVVADQIKNSSLARTYGFPSISDTLVGLTDAQVLTNKDIDGGTASNSRRVTLPKNTTTNLNALTRKQGTVAYDTTLNAPVFDDGSNLNQFGSATTSNFKIENLGIGVTSNGSALTFSITQAAGSTPAGGSGAVNVGFRSSTITTGTVISRSITSSLSMVLSSGSTLGQGNASVIYVYLLDNAGTLELAISSSIFNESGVVSTTAEGGAGAADSATVMYSTTARTNLAFRLIGKIDATQIPTGVWTTNPTAISVGSYANFESVASVATSTNGTKIIYGHFGGATYNTACTSTPCTLYTSSPEVTSVTRAAAGGYTVNFTAFSITNPKCFMSYSNSTNVLATVSSSTTTALNMNIATSNGLVATDAFVDFMCVGR